MGRHTQGADDPTMQARWDIYDKPELLAAITTAGPSGRLAAFLAMEGIHCASCVRGVQKALEGQVNNLQINIVQKTASFDFSPAQTPLSLLLRELDDAGYQPHALSQDVDAERERRGRRWSMTRLGIAAICAMQVMMLAWPDYFDGGSIDPGVEQLLRWSQWVLATPAVLFSGWPYIEAAARQLARRTVGMEVPVALSIVIAYGVSAWRTLHGNGALYFDAATMFIMLLGLGRYLEGRTRARALERLRALAGRRPLTATRISAGSAEIISLSQISRGDLLRVAPGEVLSADGILVDSTAQLDEAILTGESRPADRTVNSHVLAGSANAGSNDLTFRVTDIGEATRIAAVNRLLRSAGLEKEATQELSDWISKWFLLGVSIIAACAFATWWGQDHDRALNAALAVLVVSCPCALSLAMPMVYAAAANHLATRGVLTARGSALSQVPGITDLLIDKTGTLTRRELKVVEIYTLDQHSREECSAIAAAMERHLSHPLARAFSTLDNGLQMQSRTLETRGVSATRGGHEYWLGAADGIELPHEYAALLTSTQSWLALRQDEHVIALFGVGSELRPEARSVMDSLHQSGISITLCTGDSETPARSAAASLGIGKALWRMLPEHKLEALRTLRKGGARVMAVGDGINDAPLLAAADVSVAMPEGAAIAQIKADFILTGDNLQGLVELTGTAARARKRIRENLAWALAYNVAMLPMAFGGFLTPVLAAFGMSVSSLLVAANALRVIGPTTEK